MTEHGILFKDRLVRRILANGKTQTRRVVKEQHLQHMPQGVTSAAQELSPYGGPGDILWVRETWAIGPDGTTVWYRATDDDQKVIVKWKPGIHLFRKDARIILEITEIRAERISDISEEDAIAEGVHQNHENACQHFIGADDSCHKTAKEAFKSLWNSINAKPKPVLGEDGKVDHYVSYPFDGEGQVAVWRQKPWHIKPNPWVWALTFRRIEPHEDVQKPQPQSEPPSDAAPQEVSSGEVSERSRLGLCPECETWKDGGNCPPEHFSEGGEQR